MMDELKPCPFCGEKVALHGSSIIESFVIEHKSKRSCPFMAYYISWDYAKSLSEASEAWNRRADGGERMRLIDTDKMADITRMGDFGSLVGCMICDKPFEVRAHDNRIICPSCKRGLKKMLKARERQAEEKE